MITGFRHKGLRNLYANGEHRGIRTDLVELIEDILGRLDAAETPSALNLPGYRLHPLNWRPEGFLGRHCPRKLADHLSL